MAARASDDVGLIIYGRPSSQPSKAVYWACLLKQLPFELRVFMDRLTQYQPDFLKAHPRGLMPAIVDDGFALHEMPAILIYLCERHGWDDLLPADLHHRARVHQYLHSHHTLTRNATLMLMGPHVTNGFGEVLAQIAAASPNPARPGGIRAAKTAPDILPAGQAALRKISELIEKGYFFDDSVYLCGGHAPTIADLACYEELAQLPWTGLFTFEAYPKITRWLAAMARLPFHDAVHAYNFALGDVCRTVNTLERFDAAIIAGCAAIDSAGCRARIIPKAAASTTEA